MLLRKEKNLPQNKTEKQFGGKSINSMSYSNEKRGIPARHGPVKK